MSERVVRERSHGRPLTQRLNSLESGQRSLALRANPGALRTARSDRVAATVDVISQIVTINVTSGRWNCLAEGTISKVANGSEHFYISLDVLDPATGDPLTLPWKNLPTQQWKLGATGAIWLPFCVFGDFTADTDEVTVALLVVDDASGTAYEVLNAHLTLIPA
jgi:hypothetical protein